MQPSLSDTTKIGSYGSASSETREGWTVNLLSLSLEVPRIIPTTRAIKNRQLVYGSKILIAVALNYPS